jgi:hypothetical protein
MSKRNPWWLGLQWGALLWLPYVTFVACRDCSYTGLSDIVELWALGDWWPASYWLFAPGWLAVIVLLATGSRWTRPVVAVLMCAHFTVDFARASHATASCIQTLGIPCEVSSPWREAVPLFLPLLPLAVLRVERPRVVLALAALGRVREARARFGGVGTLLVAAVLLSTHSGAELYMREAANLFEASIPTLALATLATIVTLWTSRRRFPAGTTDC